MMTGETAPSAEERDATRAAKLDARWKQAEDRAIKAELSIFRIAPWWNQYAVTSSRDPGVVYITDGVSCSCEAGVKSDRVCMHRALVRRVQRETGVRSESEVTGIGDDVQ